MDDLKMLHNFVNDFWQFMKAYHDGHDQPDEYWQEVVTVVSKICKKYDNHPAVVNTILAYADWLEHEGSGRERNELDRRNMGSC